MARMLATRDGPLAVHHMGHGATRFVALHGFTLTGASFAALADELPAAVVAPDLPGHGATRIEPVDLDTTLCGLSALVEELDVPPVVIGYSQGGRLAAHLAALPDAPIAGIVMVSATLGLEGDARPERRHADDELARRIESEGVERFLDRWLTQPLTGAGHLDAAGAASDRSLRAENTSAGLAAALRGLGQGAIPRVTPSSVAAPSLWLAGADDAVYVERMRTDASLTGGQFEIIADAGHNLIRDAAGAVASVIARWLPAAAA